MVRNLAGLIGTVVRRGDREPPRTISRETCLVCGAGLVGSDLYTRYRVCPTCRFHYSMTARERIDSLVDAGTFRETNRSVTSIDPLSFSSRVPYRQKVLRDQQRTGLTEAVVTGTCSIGGTPTVLVVMDFGFMGGSMGCVVGEEARARPGARGEAQAADRGGSHQRRRPNTGGRPVADADGEDQLRHEPPLRQGASVHIRAIQSGDRTRVRQLRQPRRRHPGRAGSDRGVGPDADDPGVQRGTRYPAAPTPPSRTCRTG